MGVRGRVGYLAVLLLLVVTGCGSPSPAASDSSTGLEPPSFLSPVAHAVAKGIETVGIGIILLGAIMASFVFVKEWVGGEPFSGTYRRYRERLGQAILLGLEFLVAADIIGTVAVDPTFRNVGILGAIVAIRTFLSFALEVEIQGRWPWASRDGEREERRLPDPVREEAS